MENFIFCAMSIFLFLDVNFGGIVKAPTSI